jgi:murein DD-endopeptidase MepM/ murein hydrolase activator NlpD
MKNILTTLSLLISLCSFAQDGLADIAPIDRKMRTIDSISLVRLSEQETMANLQSPAASLYRNWDNEYTRSYGVALPSEYRIDLRQFHVPCDSRMVTSHYGYRRSFRRQHYGTDIKVFVGDTIRAAFSGKVRVVRYEGRGYGKYIVIRHNNGLETVYGHLSAQLVHENQIVKAGQVIGLGGNTGRSTGSHLHFETRLCGTALNPALMFDFRNQDVTGDFFTFRKTTIAHESAQATALRGVKNGGRYTREEVQGTTPAKKDNDNLADNKDDKATGLIITGDGSYYTVRQGDTLESVAERTGISIESLCRINKIGRFTTLTRGMVLKCS